VVAVSLWNFLNLIKGIYENPTDKVMFNMRD
jgi:hypothetical protein